MTVETHNYRASRAKPRRALDRAEVVLCGRDSAGEEPVKQTPAKRAVAAAVLPPRGLTRRERRAAARYRRETGMDLPIEERVRQSREQRGKVKVRRFGYIGPR